MGREIRFVKEGWQHPYANGKPVSLFDGEDYERGKKEWEEHFEKHGLQDTLDYMGEAPNEEYYMPKWSEEEKTHMQMYETTSEGTPISPVFRKDQKEEMAQWLVDHRSSMFGGMTASKARWLNVIEGGLGGVETVTRNGTKILFM